MNKDFKPSSLFNPIVNAFKNYSVTIFIVVLVGGLGAAILMLSGALQKASETNGYTPTTTTTASFDQITVKRINQLYSSSEAPADYSPPKGRINPFSE